MNTIEILGLAVIAIALAIVLARRTLKMKQEAAADDMEMTAEKFRYEMEKSADEIIGRLGDHIEKLENLIKRADEATNRIEKQIAAIKEREAAIQAHDSAPAAESKTRAEKIAAAQEAIKAASDSSQTASSENDFSRLLEVTLQQSEAVAVDLSSLERRDLPTAEHPRATAAPSAAKPSAASEPPARTAAPLRHTGQSQAPAAAPACPVSQDMPPLMMPEQNNQMPRLDYFARMREWQQSAPSYPEAGVEPIAPLERGGIAPAARIAPIAPQYAPPRRPMTIGEVETALAENSYQYDEYIEEYTGADNFAPPPLEAPAAEYLPPRDYAPPMQHNYQPGGYTYIYDDRETERYEQSAPTAPPEMTAEIWPEAGSESAEASAAAPNVQTSAAPSQAAQPEPPAAEAAAESGEAAAVAPPAESENAAAAEELHREGISEDGWPTAPLDIAEPDEASGPLPPAAPAAPEASPADEARRLLQSGLDTAEIARRVRLGKGAIDLLQQMKRK